MVLSKEAREWQPRIPFIQVYSKSQAILCQLVPFGLLSRWHGAFAAGGQVHRRDEGRTFLERFSK